MIKVKKANRILTIAETELAHYIGLGYEKVGTEAVFNAVSTEPKQEVVADVKAEVKKVDNK